jgi:hypothetical protein
MNLDSALPKLLHFAFGTFFAKKFRLFVMRPIVIFGFEKPITSALFTACETLSIFLHFPERILCLGSENISVHPEKNA